jgi:hypothetical protein
VLCGKFVGPPLQFAPGPHGPVIATALHALRLTHAPRPISVISSINTVSPISAAEREAPYAMTGINVRAKSIVKIKVRTLHPDSYATWNLTDYTD